MTCGRRRRVLSVVPWRVDRHGQKFALALRDRFEDRSAFRTVRQAIGGVLNIASGEDLSRARQDCGSNPELRIGRIGRFRGATGGRNETADLRRGEAHDGRQADGFRAIRQPNDHRRKRRERMANRLSAIPPVVVFFVAFCKSEALALMTKAPRCESICDALYKAKRSRRLSCRFLARIFHSFRHRYDHLSARVTSVGGVRRICGLMQNRPSEERR